MVTPELISYIKSELARGIARETISSTLSVQGWALVDIIEAFNYLNLNSEKKSEQSIIIINKNFYSSKPGIIAIIILLIVIFGAVGYFFSRSLSGQISVESDILSKRSLLNNVPSMNEETRQYFENYTKDFLKYLSIESDPFNLSSKDRSILDDISNKLKLSSTKGLVVFDGKVYSEVETYKKGDTFYLKPKGSIGLKESDYFRILASKNIKPEEFYNNISNKIHKEIYKIAYDNLSQKISEKDTVIKIKEYLDSQIKVNGDLKKYDYDEVGKEFSLFEFEIDSEFSYSVKPFIYAENMDFIIKTYANSLEYINGLIADFNSRIKAGQVLVINTKNNTYSFLDGDSFQSDILTLLGSKSQEDKLSQIAGNVRIGKLKEEVVTKSSAMNSNYAASLSAAVDTSYSDLIYRDGVIVSPSKKINYIKGADFIRSRETQMRIGEDLFSLSDIKDSNNGSLSSFLKNDYYINIEKQFLWNQKAVEDMSDILSDDSSSITFFHTHGATQGLYWAEVWDLGPVNFSETEESYKNYTEKFNLFKARVNELRKTHSGYFRFLVKDESVLGDDEAVDLKKYDLMLEESYKFLIKDAVRLTADIVVNADFFQKYTSRKSLFILHACYGGLMNKNINSRVLVTTDPTWSTRGILFQADMKKIDSYLLKKQDPGPFAVTLENMRNYDITKLFSSANFELNAFPSFEICNSMKDTFCTIRIYSTDANQTISVSPHVKAATGENIEFNAPMEKVYPEKVVTIDASKCGTSKKVLDETKPAWSGDKNIILNWKDKVYRDWKTEDFNGGIPKVNYAVITVKNDQAVSKISHVKLTGNSDACANIVSPTCLHSESWADPAGIKYNGNNPKTDFVMMFPCIEDDYYASCKAGVTPNIAKIKSEEGVTHPDYISTNGNCYHKIIATEVEKKQAVEVTNWTNDSTCSDKCVPEKKDLSCTDFNNLLTTGDINTILGSDSATMVIEGPLNPKPGRPGPLCTSLWKNLRTSDMHNYNEFQKFQQSLPGDAGKSIDPSQIWDELEKPPVAVEAMLGLMSVYGQFIKDRLEPFHELHGGDYGISFMGLMMNGKIINNGSLLGSDKTSKVCDNVNPMDKVTGKVGVKKTDLTDLGDGEACLLESNTDKIVRFIKNSDIKVPGGLSSFYPLYVRVEKDKSDSQAIELARLLFSRVNEFLK